MFGDCLLIRLSGTYVYSAMPSSRGFNRLCFGTMQLFEEVVYKTALPQSNLHASSPSKSTTASFISTNLTIHTNSVQPIRRARVPKPTEAHYPRSIISPFEQITPPRFSKRANSKNTTHYTQYAHDRPPRHVLCA